MPGTFSGATSNGIGAHPELSGKRPGTSAIGLLVKGEAMTPNDAFFYSAVIGESIIAAGFLIMFIIDTGSKHNGN